MKPQPRGVSQWVQMNQGTTVRAPRAVPIRKIEVTHSIR